VTKILKFKYHCLFPEIKWNTSFYILTEKTILTLHIWLLAGVIDLIILLHYRSLISWRIAYNCLRQNDPTPHKSLDLGLGLNQKVLVLENFLSLGLEKSVVYISEVIVLYIMLRQHRYHRWGELSDFSIILRRFSFENASWYRLKNCKTVVCMIIWCLLLRRTLLLIAGQSRVCSNESFALFVASAWKTVLPFAAKVSCCRNFWLIVMCLVQPFHISCYHLCSISYHISCFIVVVFLPVNVFVVTF